MESRKVRTFVSRGPSVAPGNPNRVRNFGETVRSDSGRIRYGWSIRIRGLVLRTDRSIYMLYTPVCFGSANDTGVQTKLQDDSTRTLRII